MKFLHTTLLFVMVVASSLDAKIIEAQQLFNKTIVKVQEEKTAIVKQFYGQTQLNSSDVRDVVVRFDGYITKLHASKEFMYLKKGEPLFSIYSNELTTIQKEFKIVEKINPKLAASAFEKLVALDIDAQELTKIKKSQKSLDDITFYSPMNAILMKKNINQGSFAKKGMLLLQLANIDELWFIAQVYQSDLAFIKKGMHSKVRIDGIDQPIETTVDFIYPTINEATKTVNVRFIINNKEGKLSPNMFAKVDIATQVETMLTLPKSAVITKANKHYVFLQISPKEFEPIEVNAKRISANKFQITSGVKAGEEVIDNALFLLDSDAVTNSLYSKDEEW